MQLLYYTIYKRSVNFLQREVSVSETEMLGCVRALSLQQKLTRLRVARTHRFPPGHTGHHASDHNKWKTVLTICLHAECFTPLIRPDPRLFQVYLDFSYSQTGFIMVKVLRSLIKYLYFGIKLNIFKHQPAQSIQKVIFSVLYFIVRCLHRSELKQNHQLPKTVQCSYVSVAAYHNYSVRVHYFVDNIKCW